MARDEASQRGRLRGAIGRAVYWVSVAALWGGIGLAGVIGYYALDLPSTQNLWDRETGQRLSIYAEDDTQLAQRGQGGGTMLTYEALPKSLIAATVAIEDRRFFDHMGIDIRGLVRAVMVNVRAGGVVQGGSTLTQQLAKNIFLTPERSAKRKIQELVLALWLEAQLSKQEILALYLNRVYFGSGAYGVKAAAQTYFARPVQELTIAESAMLAGLLKAPSRYAPNRNFARAAARADLVLDAMVQIGSLTAQARAQIDPAQIGIRRGKDMRAGYAVDWTLELLPDFIGPAESDLDVVTTIDPKLQRMAQNAVAKAINTVGTSGQFGQAALVAMTPDGAVRAMVGGVDYHASPFNRAVYARRQPGSAFKPFVYLAGLQNGLSPTDEFVDEPVAVGGWVPKNYNDDYAGVVDVTTAFARSINTVAVQISERTGRDETIRLARRLGLQSSIAPHPSLALGAVEVSLLELVSAYASFANGGMQIFPHIIVSVNDARGRILYQRQASSVHRILDTETLDQLNGLMRAAVETGTGRAAALPGQRVYGKTGTSQNWRDAWFIGYTDRLVVGVWVGNDDNSPMARVAGGGVPARIWREFMVAARDGGLQEAPTAPDIFQPKNRGLFDWLLGGTD